MEYFVKSSNPEKQRAARVVVGVLERLTFDVPRRSDLPSGERGLKEALAIAAGHRLAKDLANLPGNLCTPTYLAEAAQKLPGQYPIKVKVLEEADMQRLGMGSLLS